MRSKSRRVLLLSLFIGFAVIVASFQPGPAQAAGGYAAFRQDVADACSIAGLQLNEGWALTISTLGGSSNPLSLSEYNWSCKNECRNKNFASTACTTFCNTLFK